MNPFIAHVASCLSFKWLDTGTVPAVASKAYHPHLETLESRVVRTAYSVGPGQAYADLWQVPWDSLSAGDRVKVYWQPEAYHSKIDINTSGLSIIGIPGPDGQLPVLDANGAQENPSAAYFTDQIANEGLITVAPAAYNQVVRNVFIGGLELENANVNNYFFDANGNFQWYNVAGAGVAMYEAQNVRIAGCRIHDNGNGIFGKSFGWSGGDLVNVQVIGNDIFGNGVWHSDHMHNTYIEGWYTVYEYNHYGNLMDGAWGNNLKDRSVAPIIEYNYFEGGAHLLDLVEPEDGASDMVGDPSFGAEWVYGNVLVNPDGAATSSIVHFGFDNVYEDSQQTLYFYNNTVVNYNSVHTNRYYTYVFKIDGDGTAYVFDNVFASVSLQGDWSGMFYLSWSEWGSPTVFVGTNVGPSEMLPGRDTYVGWENMILDDNVGFVDILGGDFRLTTDSPALGVAQGIYCGDGFVDEVGLPTVDYQYDFVDGGGWVDRTDTTNLGAWQSDPPDTANSGTSLLSALTNARTVS
jgi:hypothetical protein